MDGFQKRAERAGAFGSHFTECRYHEHHGVGVGWRFSESQNLPCLVGFYSECPVQLFRKSLRELAKRLCDDLRRRRYDKCIVSLDWDNPRFEDLLKFYQKVLGFELAGTHDQGLVLTGDVDRLERF